MDARGSWGIQLGARERTHAPLRAAVVEYPRLDCTWTVATVPCRLSCGLWEEEPCCPLFGCVWRGSECVHAQANTDAYAVWNGG